jgi:hypothetical protein
MGFDPISFALGIAAFILVIAVITSVALYEVNNWRQYEKDER